MFTNVLVGIDRHTQGRDALALARQLADPTARLTLAHVYPGDSRLRRDAALDYRRMEQERALELLTEARDAGGVDAELRYVESSSSGRGLHELAEAIDADLLVVGSSRHGCIRRLLLGDDSRGTLSGSPCPVAIAPADYSQTACDSGEGPTCLDMTLTS